jgi:hypothetical protein
MCSLHRCNLASFYKAEMLFRKGGLCVGKGEERNLASSTETRFSSLTHVQFVLEVCGSRC